MILLVRHGSAGDRESWVDDDSQRPLDQKGRHQADGLVGIFAPYRITQILSSRYLRCVQTVEPLAEARGITVHEVKWLEEARDPDYALRQLLQCQGEGLVACSHGDVIAGILLTLTDSVEAIGASPAMKKGSTWCLDTHQGKVVNATYLDVPS